MTHRRRTLSVHEQVAWMRVYWPSFACSAARNKLVCRGSVQPTPLNEFYRFVIVYVVGHRPHVFVPGQLRRRDPERRIPHTYSDDEPCLFYSSEWRSDMKIATSIVSWLLLWLHYYEIWRATGEWLGGGIEHGEGPKV